MTPNVFKHPEWKRLYDALASSIEPGQLWSYEQLSELAGINCRSRRGRAQFLRFRDELLKKQGWWMVCVVNEGYRVIHPNEQPAASLNLVKLGRNRIHKGATVNAAARIEMMAQDMAKTCADLMVRTAALEYQASAFVKEFRKQIGKAELQRLPSPMLDKVG